MCSCPSVAKCIIGGESERPRTLSYRLGFEVARPPVRVRFVRHHDDVSFLENELALVVAFSWVDFAVPIVDRDVARHVTALLPPTGPTERELSGSRLSSNRSLVGGGGLERGGAEGGCSGTRARPSGYSRSLIT
eukprot:SAG31_NODE_10182_length_1174_cov_1.051163_3_plen_134_part_00